MTCMFPPGTEIIDKRYVVHEKLGGGAFGEIYKGKLLSLYAYQSRNNSKMSINRDVKLIGFLLRS